MPFQFYKSKILANAPSGSVPPVGVYIKSDVSNVNDGGVILRCGYGDNYASRTFQFTSGSISSSQIVSQNISQFVAAISSSDGPYVEIPESEFVDFYSGSVAFFDNLG